MLSDMGMMINRRRVCGEKGLLPSGYTQLEYIENTSQAYIDTGVVDLVGNVYELNVLPVTTTSKYRHQMSGANMGININVQNLKWQIATTITVSVDFNNFQNLIAERTSTARTLTINEKTFTASAGSNTTFNFFIGQVAGFDSYIPVLPTKFSNCKIWSSGNLIRNFIPCKNPNNVVGMYDTVNGVFYSSPNGTAFVAGPEV